MFKSGRKDLVSNYRPIAKLSCIPKLFERIIYDSIYFQCKSIFSPVQHGFLKGKSTTTNLTGFVSSTLNILESGSEVDVIATDFSKAFDKISHGLILFKLNKLGFPSGFTTWIDSYLTDRRYRVVFRLAKSEPFTAKSGVPQGSHLGPLLIIIAINDVDQIIKYSNISLYADDAKIFKTITLPRDFEALQKDLDNFAVWCNQNQLILNVNKCQFITYTRKRITTNRAYYLNGVAIDRVDRIRDLGVLCDKKLSFLPHYNYIIARANSTLGFVKRWSKEFSEPFVTRSLYMALVRPLLEYASQVWSPFLKCDIDRIEAVQKRFLRFAFRDLPWVDNFHLPPSHRPD